MRHWQVRSSRARWTAFRAGPRNQPWASQYLRAGSWGCPSYPATTAGSTSLAHPRSRESPEDHHWLADPRRAESNPFPAPRRDLYRLHWPRTEITSWRIRNETTAPKPAG